MQLRQRVRFAPSVFGCAQPGAELPSVTRDATREKLGSALNIDGPDVIATTSGYIGDAPTYQGHVALISRARGRVVGAFNTLCSRRRTIIVPTSCPQSDSTRRARRGRSAASQAPPGTGTARSSSTAT